MGKENTESKLLFACLAQLLSNQTLMMTDTNTPAAQELMAQARENSERLIEVIHQSFKKSEPAS